MTFCIYILLFIILYPNCQMQMTYYNDACQDFIDHTVQLQREMQVVDF